MHTIEFNTGRLYGPEGQIIRVGRLDGLTVAFADMTRRIDGIIEAELIGDFETPEQLQALVMERYDHNAYRFPANEAEQQALRALEALDKAEG